MLTIVLRSNLGMSYGVDPHPAFVDLPGYQTDERRNDTEIDVHEDAALAPLVARLHGKPALDTVPMLWAAYDHVQKERPDRTDGAELAKLLMSWATRWPDAYWDVSGPALRVMAECGGETGVIFTGELNARVSARNVATDDLSAAPMGTGEVEKLEVDHDPEKCPLGTACHRCNGVRERDLQRENHVRSTGGGSRSGRVRRDRPTSQADRNARTQRAMQEDGLTRPRLLGARVSEGVAEVFARRGSAHGVTAGEGLQILGEAILSGLTFAEVRDRLKGTAA